MLFSSKVTTSFAKFMMCSGAFSRLAAVICFYSLTIPIVDPSIISSASFGAELSVIVDIAIDISLDILAKGLSSFALTFISASLLFAVFA